MAYVDDLKTARDNLAAELKAETVRRKALVDAGNPPPTNYSVSGKSVDWNGYLAAMTARLKDLNQEIIAADTPYEESVRGYT
jgi:hypothetical protein